ncbi:GNAT family N-acetyltransferase [Thiohalomonas denitrificans]|uniref:GNAT family N-acetyltransferase n=1 Tax=Thiohalomonas denitrificans TaxID=415747 RepID=UPI0026EF1A70|nr:GNAT family N-acetyltransferase [Thiohalomonas denitrificans]
MKIRKADPTDAPAIQRFQEASIRELCSDKYDAETIEQWTGDLKPDHYLDAMEKYQFLVAEEDGGEIEAMCVVDTDRSELNALFVAPQATGKGLGKVLVASAEGVVLNAGHHRISLKATLNAVPFYEKLGFRRKGETMHSFSEGTELACIVMSKTLTPDKGKAA